MRTTGAVFRAREGRLKIGRRFQTRPTTLIHFILPLAGQQIGHNTASKEDATFKVSTQLVVETVVVKDKSGNAVEGLTAKDFTITENGVSQTIKFFEYQKLQDTPDATPLTVEPNRAKLLDKLP